MSKKTRAKKQASSRKNTQKETDSFVVLLEDESSEPDKAAPEPDESGESFVVLFEEETPAGSEAVSNSGSDDETFVILLDDEEQSDQDTTVVHFDDRGHCLINLPSDIRIGRISFLKGELEKSLDADNVTYDVSRVKMMDSASVQLLYSHLQSMKELKTDIHWEGSSELFRSSVHTLGFDFADNL